LQGYHPGGRGTWSRCKGKTKGKTKGKNQRKAKGKRKAPRRNKIAPDQLPALE
jgi:hypothetical protein